MSDIPKCENCPIRRRAEQKPNSFMARLWRWHTGWCPGWKRYQRWLAANKNFVTTHNS